jgi:hypothetical protein
VGLGRAAAGARVAPARVADPVRENWVMTRGMGGGSSGNRSKEGQI